MKNIIYESHHDKTKGLTVSYRESADVNCHFHRSYELLYIVDGKLEANIMNKSFIASKDDIVFVNKYYSHSYKIVGEYKKYVLIIPPRMCDDFDDVFKDKTLSAHLNDKEFNKSLLSIIKSLNEKNSSSTELVKKGYVNVIIGELLNHYKLVSIKKNSNIEVMVKILDYIDHNYGEDLTLESISKHFGYSKYYFSRLFNDYINENINNYINMIRIQHVVKEIKENKDGKIADIVYNCGFSSLPTFYRSFKKIYGVSPKEELGI